MKTSTLVARSSAFLWILLGPFSPLYATTFHVDMTTGVDVAGCGSQASPCASIQQAVNQAANTGDTILVAEGTYTYDAGLDPCTDETAVVCIVGKKLTILGGFASNDWTQSDPTNQPTIIDGENFQRGVLVKRTSPTSPSGANLRLEGFTIHRGLAGPTPNRPEDRRGGGLKAALVDSLVLRDVRFDNNVAEGADTGSDDGGNGTGGGVSVSSAEVLPLTQVTLDNVTFTSNQAVGGTGPVRGGFALGGGLFINQAEMTASGLTFHNNAAAGGNSSGSGLLNGQRADSLGGGMAILANTVVVAQGLTATGNTSTGGTATGTDGIGGVGAGAGIYVERASLELRDGLIESNSSAGGDGAATGGLGTGGGITTFDSTLVLDRVALLNNQVNGGDGPTKKGSAGGGGAYLNRLNDLSATTTILNSIIADNHVSIGTGGGTVGGGGGGVFVLRHDVSILHSTFARNSLGTDPMAGQAISVVTPDANPAQAAIDYTIIADHTSLDNVPAVNVRSGGSADFEQGLFAGNENDTNEGTINAGTFTGLETMLSATSADFVSPGAPDFDYHVSSSSPAIDEATNSTVDLDFDNTQRQHPRDIGADEACSAAEDLVLSNGTVSGSSLELACQTITAGPYVVESTGDLTLQAGAKVILTDGFRVDDGGRLEVVIQLP